MSLHGAQRNNLNKPWENNRQIQNVGHSTGWLAWSLHTHPHTQLQKTFLAQVGKLEYGSDIRWHQGITINFSRYNNGIVVMEENVLIFKRCVLKGWCLDACNFQTTQGEKKTNTAKYFFNLGEHIFTELFF